MRGNLAMSGKTMPLATGLDVRLAARSGALDAPTSGLAPGFVQGNLAILPREYAEDFLRFCQANPKPCPLLGVSEAGDPAIPALGADLDIRTDIRVIASGATVRWSTSRATSRPCGVAIWSVSCSAARSRSRKRCCRLTSRCAISSAAPVYRCGAPTFRHSALGVSMHLCRLDAVR